MPSIFTIALLTFIIGGIVYFTATRPKLADDAFATMGRWAFILGLAAWLIDSLRN